MKKPEPAIISPEAIAPLVHWLRHEKIMLDSDLAELYGVTTGRLNEAVKRNLDRFPADFMFQPTGDEMEILISQIAISSSAPSALKFQSGRSTAHGGRRHLPYAFTEQGVAMLSSVLRSQRAVEVNIAIMRTLAQKIGEMEDKYDGQFRVVFDAIRQLISPPAQPSRELGFHTIPPAKPAKNATRSRHKP